jgi:DNA polymerase
VCPWARKATQTVFGEGPEKAAIMFVGEQPGDQEDVQGRPFVGPAGKLLFEICDELGIPRDEIYVTNAVKHFKFSPRGKRRLHQKPNAADMHACHPWLEREVDTVQPQVIFALGATAAKAVCGRDVKITKEHGEWLKWPSTEREVMVSFHPSAILRAIDPASRQKMRAELKKDLRKAWSRVR